MNKNVFKYPVNSSTLRLNISTIWCSKIDLITEMVLELPVDEFNFFTLVDQELKGSIN